MTPELAINIAIATAAIGGAFSAILLCLAYAAFDALRPRRVSRRAARRAAFYR